ncbi:MAG: dCTP deaminase [archaeon]
MSILTRTEILSQIKKGAIKIDPFSETKVGPASVDLTLGNEFRVYKNTRLKIDLKENINLEKITRLVKCNSLILKRGESVLGITLEKITLPQNMCGWLEGRSRFARVGFQIHTTASFVQPGVSNRQVLEIANISPFSLVLYPGESVCQLIIEKLSKKVKYQGRFSSQDHL